MFGFADLVALLNGRHLADVACPLCGPSRNLLVGQARPVLRLWHRPGFISFHCARCGEHGYVLEHGGEPFDKEAWLRQRAEMTAREREAAVRQLGKARRLWRMRRPLKGSVADTYLREARGITCSLPS